MLKSLWNAPNIKHQINLRQLVGASGMAALAGVILLAVAKLLESNAGSFGKWAPVVGAFATLVIQLIRVLNLGEPDPAPTPEPVPTPPTPTPTPKPTNPDIPPDRYVNPA